MSSHAPTAGQTVGPFFHYALPFPGDNRLVGPTRPDAVRLHGVVYDGEGSPVPDAIIELWQTDGAGRIVAQSGSLSRDDWTFTGWGRCATDACGHYTFTTVAPGSTTPGRPPFFALIIFARGLLNRLFTRAYLPEGNLDADPLLSGLSAPRRRTLICAAEPGAYRFDVRLQGEHETTFLAFAARR